MKSNKEMKEIEERREPSHKMDGKYTILMETDQNSSEQWYNFIRVEGNEENLNHLAKQLEQVDFELIEDLSTFDLEMDYLVSAQTAKDMSKVDLNPTNFHKKFDGTLKRIDFSFSKKDGNTTKISKVYDTLGDGNIDEYISDEDIDDEDLATDDESVSDNESESDSSSDDESEDERMKEKKKLPTSILRERLREQIKEKQNDRKKGTYKEKMNCDE